MSFIEEFFKSMARVLGRIIVYIILGFIMFYIINDKVNAATYEWNTPRLVGIYKTGGIGDESQTLVSCNLNSSDNCNSISTYDIVSGAFKSPGKNYYARYRFSDLGFGNNIPKETYSISFKAKFALVEDISIASVTPIMYYYPNSTNNYGIATCDTEPISSLIQVGVNPTTYEYTYSCSKFNITADVSWLAIGFQQTANLRYVNIMQNLRLGGPGETQDIINNQNQNTQDIINNQNQNQNQTNEGLQDIEDAILDDSQPNLDNFNYTDSTGGLISTFLTMPITLLRVMNNVETCRSITLGELFGTPLRLDCINPQVFLGETLWKIIDYFIVFNMITSISQLFVYVYEKFKNLDDFFNEFYTPQHIGPDEYVPRHGGGK